MTRRALPRDPSLKLFQDQARELLRDFRRGIPLTLARQALFDSLFDHSDSGLKLSDAQYMVAREYGYAGWTHLQRHIVQLAFHSYWYFH